ncbi:hypothetical protein BDY24DRAFT_419525 [Mrakia frigida]|uniref:uncharacterized protein n=1 Tax=Mrakia frigida TaxID=29902 RepID=UPI003FCC04C3
MALTGSALLLMKVIEEALVTIAKPERFEEMEKATFNSVSSSDMLMLELSNSPGRASFHRDVSGDNLPAAQLQFTLDFEWVQPNPTGSSNFINLPSVQTPLVHGSHGL